MVLGCQSYVHLSTHLHSCSLGMFDSSASNTIKLRVKNTFDKDVQLMASDKQPAQGIQVRRSPPPPPLLNKDQGRVPNYSKYLCGMETEVKRLFCYRTYTNGTFFCFVLFCFVLLCFVLFCFVLFCFVLLCFVLFLLLLLLFVVVVVVLFCFVLFCFVLFFLNIHVSKGVLIYSIR